MQEEQASIEHCFQIFSTLDWNTGKMNLHLLEVDSGQQFQQWVFLLLSILASNPETCFLFCSLPTHLSTPLAVFCLEPPLSWHSWGIHCISSWVAQLFFFFFFKAHAKSHLGKKRKLQLLCQRQLNHKCQSTISSPWKKNRKGLNWEK